MNPTPDSETELDLTHYMDIILRRRWIVLSALSIVFISTMLVTFTTKPIYQASSLLVIEKERSSSNAVYTNGALIESSNDDYYQTQYKLLQSKSLTQKVFDDLHLSNAADFADPRGIEKFRNALTISPVLRSRLVYVRVQSHNPHLAAKAANALSETFVDQNLSNQLFISKEVLQALQVNEDSPKARQMYEALPAVVSNPLIQTLKGEHAKLEAQCAEMSQKFTAKYPAMIALRSNLNALKGQIQAETDKVVQSLKTELSGQLRGNNVRIVDSATVPESPIKPTKRTNALLGLIGGLGLGLALAFLVEMIDQSVRTQEDIEEKLGQPFLGIIPQSIIRNNTIIEAMLAKELSLTSEAFRNMRTMVDFAGIGGKAKTVLLTSTVQGEGKTYIASNLAVAWAQIGESVLLIDGDLRRPKIHKAFHLSAEKGLSDFLVSGRHTEDVANLVQQCVVPGLSLLPCGQRPPNPSELLNTPRLGAMIAWAQEHYDRVVVDSTPMFPINDTLLWGRHIPSSIFVVRYGETRTPLIRSACQKLITSSIKPLGVAINAAKAGGLSYASYGYYYQQYYQQYHQESELSKKST
ncbi:MAG TPA: hypothetical protein DEB40_10840 [Elusimicrobia bacterium]|nr:hypothetical protein [Elusimicrobiota bacterium]HBT62226.1 hypothetical protein [Elusimicrobiota bacterium]